MEGLAGRGVPKDEAEAAKWYRKAAEDGSAEAMTWLGIMLAERRGVSLLCEVNTRPRNDTSLAFHEAWGFKPVGEQDVAGGSKTVMMLALDTRKAA